MLKKIYGFGMRHRGKLAAAGIGGVLGGIIAAPHISAYRGGRKSGRGYRGEKLQRKKAGHAALMALAKYASGPHARRGDWSGANSIEGRMKKRYGVRKLWMSGGSVHRPKRQGTKRRLT